MAQTVKEVVKIIAPIALEALATAAEALLAGEAVQAVARTLPTGHVKANGDDLGEIVEKDTWTYCETNFATQYGYYYAGETSQPTSGDLPVAAGEDIIVWEQHNGIENIQSYLSTVFKDSISDPDSIEISKNLGALFQQRFAEEALDWTPFSKRFNFRDNLIVDTYMVTASAHDTDNNPAGVASYCWVAYNHKA
ncbi:MAG: hypothetical protein WAV45_00135 [Propionibacteriaceae bacterium]|uniref:hypothetical protein n=1 Tax=Micropruina sp. TaxID=2737536 RepID=UPI002635632F|nr:hypothetical protein [Micropruina sp.]